MEAAAGQVSVHGGLQVLPGEGNLLRIRQGGAGKIADGEGRKEILHAETGTRILRGGIADIGRSDLAAGHGIKPVIDHDHEGMIASAG